MKTSDLLDCTACDNVRVRRPNGGAPFFWLRLHAETTTDDPEGDGAYDIVEWVSTN